MGPAHNYRDDFKAPRSALEPAAGPPKMRAVVEAERWRSKWSIERTLFVRPADDRLEPYSQPSSAGWALERLLGTSPPTVEEIEDEEQETRLVRVVGQAWMGSPSWVDVNLIDRLEDTLRRRLGELESSTAHAGRAARSFFADCDPMRSGRVLRGHFEDQIGRKLNYDFSARGSSPSSRDVLAALVERYDLARGGVLAAEDFHAALIGATREGRASGRVVSLIGRLREGLVRYAGGFDALRLEETRWFAAQKEGGHSLGCLPAGSFVDGVLRLGLLAQVPVSDADLNVLVAAFEPPRDRAVSATSEPLVSYEEFMLAVRGPPMRGERVQLVRAAYAALKEDASKGMRKEVKPAHLAARYDVANHPAVQAGALREEEAAMAFLEPWAPGPRGATREMLEEEVTLREFAERYEWISPLISDEDDFARMMKAAWNLK